jgi:hypothetical protein
VRSALAVIALRCTSQGREGTYCIDMNRNILKTVYKVSDFLSWQRNRSLVLSPSFQRRSVWPRAAKSLLLDSIVKGIPMPIIFLREQTDLSTLEPVREVVDGQQRLRTLIAYIDPTLLKDFNKDRDQFTLRGAHNKELANKAFGDLGHKLKQEILNYDFSVHILPSDTEDRDVLQIFARMNSTGIKLNAQELRNSEFFGVFKETMYGLAYEQLPRWRSWRVFSENDIARMLEVEETSELIRLMIQGQEARSQPALNTLYSKFEDSFLHAGEVTRRFRFIMDQVDMSLGHRLADLEFSRRGLFDTLFTFYYDLAFGLNSQLRRRSGNAIPALASRAIVAASDAIASGTMDAQLSKVLRGGTGNRESREIRLKFVKGIFARAKV